MGSKVISLVSIVFLLAVVNTTFGQEVASKRKVDAAEGEYLVHTVEAKQTLYAISKMYSVSIEDIQKANPELENLGIRIGQTLRIPVKAINKKEAKKSIISFSSDTIYHQVVKKETVYALTKKYEISEKELLEYNPSLSEGLKVGSIVKIPVKEHKAGEGTPVKFVEAKEDSLVLHEVLPKETLYSLAKLYKVSPDSIQMVNEGLQKGLQIGATIRIPIPNENFNIPVNELEKIDSNYTKTLANVDTMYLGVFLPFCMTKNLELQEVNENEDVYVLTKISLEFMRGLKLATDSLSKLGYHINTRYYDTKNDTSECRRIVNEEDLGKYHLLIGPMFQVNFKILALKAKELNTPIISPVKISSRLLLDNKYVIKTRSSSPSQVIYEAQYMGEKYVDSNLVLFSGGSAEDKRYSTIFQKYLNNAIGDSIPIHRVWTPNTDNFKRHLKMNESNIVALVSSDEAFVSSALSIFYGWSNEETRFTVLGMNSWKKFGSLDFDYLLDLNVIFPVQQQIEYYTPDVMKFVESYRNEYYQDPTPHVFTAFDIGSYFIDGFFKSNGNWEGYLSETKKSGLSLRFDFVKIGLESGFENRGSFLLKYSDNGLHLIH